MPEYTDISAELTPEFMTANEDPFVAPVGLEGVDEDAMANLPDLFHGATKSLPDTYANEREDASPFRGEAKIWSHHSPDNKDTDGNTLPQDQWKTEFSQIATRYLDEDEKSKAAVSVKDGKLVGPEGNVIDTSQATGTGTQHGGGRGKHIFAMDEEKTVRSVDPWAEHREISLQPQRATGAPVQPIMASYLDTQGNLTEEYEVKQEEGPEKKRLEMVNHSSLVNGGRVTGAGELTVDEGKLTQVSDASGHYQPDGPMLHNTVQHFADQGVDTAELAVKMVGKHKGEKPLIASATEFMQLEPEDAETLMRDQRQELASELEDAVDERSDRVAKNGGFKDPLDARQAKNQNRGGRVQDLIGVYEGMY